MKKFYSLVLMATALLIGTNAWATSYADIQDAINAAAAGSTVDIELSSNVSVTTPIQIYAKKNVTGKTVNINLNGWNITSATGVVIELYKGTLNLIGEGQIATTAKIEAIKVFGANEDVADWSVLNIGSGVTVSSSQNAISVLGFYGKNVYRYMNAAGATAGYTGKALDGTNGALDFYVENDTYSTYKQGTTIKVNANALAASGDIDYTTSYPSYKTTPVSGKTYHDYSGENTMAYGVKIEVLQGAIVAGEKYGIKINGTIRYNGTNLPYVHVANGAEVRTNPTANEATAVYSSGYGNIVIEGYVHGSTGVYVKAGNVSVEEGAVIASDNNSENGTKATGASSGINSGGNAIAIEGDNAAYSSNGISVNINGGTIEAGENGYAVQNTNNAVAQSNPNTVTISGGEFEGGAAGCVTIDNTNGNVDVELEGGTFTGDIQTLVEAVADEENIISQVVATDGSGNATVVIGKKEDTDVVVVDPDITFVNDMANEIVKLNATTANISKTLPAGTTTVKYLSLTGTGAYTSTVTIENGKTLKVGQIVMDANGRIIVEKGGQLIVTGAQGIFAENNVNLQIAAKEGQMGKFMQSPAVEFNKNPYATVTLETKAHKVDADNFIYQRMGVPAFGGIKAGDIKANPTSAGLALAYWDGATQDWAWVTSSSFVVEPFVGLALTNNATTEGTKYTMPCQLMGNSDANLTLMGEWTSFANSYMADVDLYELLGDIKDAATGASASAYVYDAPNDWWKTISYADLEAWKNASGAQPAYTTLEPLQGFIFNNIDPAINATALISYEKEVWDPVFDPNHAAPLAAPARKNDNTTRVQIVITAANGQSDDITLRQSEDFSAAFDNGYDVKEMVNINPINIYATTELGEMAQLSTDNLAGTKLSVATKGETDFTMTFSNLNGETLAIRDNLTGSVIDMTEGAEYVFSVAENSVSERFEIVGIKTVPTGIEAIQNAEGSKAIYTILGQYVGTAADWSVLPAGIYVIDGVKVVK